MTRRRHSIWLTHHPAGAGLGQRWMRPLPTAENKSVRSAERAFRQSSFQKDRNGAAPAEATTTGSGEHQPHSSSRWRRSSALNATSCCRRRNMGCIFSIQLGCSPGAGSAAQPVSGRSGRATRQCPCRPRHWQPSSTAPPAKNTSHVQRSPGQKAHGTACTRSAKSVLAAAIANAIPLQCSRCRLLMARPCSRRRQTRSVSAAEVAPPSDSATAAAAITAAATTDRAARGGLPSSSGMLLHDFSEATLLPYGVSVGASPCIQVRFA